MLRFVRNMTEAGLRVLSQSIGSFRQNAPHQKFDRCRISCQHFSHGLSLEPGPTRNVPGSERTLLPWRSGNLGGVQWWYSSVASGVLGQASLSAYGVKSVG